MEQRRTLIAIVLSIAILLLWDMLFVRPNTKKPLPNANEKEVSATTAERKVKPGVPANVAKGLAKVNQQGTSPGRKIVVDTPLYRAVWNTKGAELVSLRLKKYRETLGAGSPPVEMIHAGMPRLKIKGGMDTSSINFQTRASSMIEVKRGPFELKFTSPDMGGLAITHVYTINPGTYEIGYRTIFTNTTKEPMVFNADISMEEAYSKKKSRSRYIFEGPVLLNGKHLEEFKLSRIKKPGEFRQFEGPIKWFGFEDKYFLKTLVVKDPLDSELYIKRTRDMDVDLSYGLSEIAIPAGSKQSLDMLFYIGPKELKTLKLAGYDLNKALDFGFFDFFAKPMLISLNWINSYIHSYGWSIIILTVIIKLLLYPLSLKSFKSMKELQKIQPLMKEIQAKYKDDKSRLNQELMKLYSEHKVNPMGGCLPMLLQIPILFALYRIFLSAIELRHTPFHIVGTWLPDLSAKDPYYITPILMGLSWFIQQKMTPMGGDPTQQKMMLFMPVIFTIFFLNFPSGLVIYWLVSNVLSIAQQAYINRVHTI